MHQHTVFHDNLIELTPRTSVWTGCGAKPFPVVPDPGDSYRFRRDYRQNRAHGKCHRSRPYFLKNLTGAEGLAKEEDILRADMICSRPCKALGQDPGRQEPVNQIVATCALHTVFPGKEISLPLKIKLGAHISILHVLRIFLSENNVGANRWKDQMASDVFGTLLFWSMVY